MTVFIHLRLLLWPGPTPTTYIQFPSKNYLVWTACFFFFFFWLAYTFPLQLQGHFIFGPYIPLKFFLTHRLVSASFLCSNNLLAFYRIKKTRGKTRFRSQSSCKVKERMEHMESKGNRNVGFLRPLYNVVWVTCVELLIHFECLVKLFWPQSFIFWLWNVILIFYILSFHRRVKKRCQRQWLTGCLQSICWRFHCLYKDLDCSPAHIRAL